MMPTFRLTQCFALFVTLYAVTAKTATSSPVTNHLEPRVPRCDFPGELFNACTFTSMIYKFDTGPATGTPSSSGDTTPPQPNFSTLTLSPGENSLASTCDADFIEVRGYTLLVDSTDVGPYKGLSKEERTVRDGGEWKMDAYTLTCKEEEGEERADGRGGGGIDEEAASSPDAGCKGEKVVRCSVKYNGNQF